MRSARGRSFSRKVATASSLSSRAPLVATITGSTTTLRGWYSPRHWAMVSMRAAEETMPIFTLSGGMSEKTACSCWRRNWGVASKMAVTPVVFWAVRAVTAVMA